MKKIIIKSYDEEYGFAERAGEVLTDELNKLGLDCVNKEYILIVDIEEV